MANETTELPASTPSAELPDIARHFEEAPMELLGAVLDQSLDCIKVIGPTGQLDFMNRNGRCAMEIDDFNAVAGRDWWDLWPEESQHLIRDAVDRARNGQSHRFEAFCPTAKGTPRWWEVAVSPLVDDGGSLRGIVSVSRDVTDRINATELRNAAADEMKHRLKNAYALAGAIMSAAASGSPERQAFAQEVLDRLSKLSLAQSLLLDPAALGSADLATLFRRLTEPFCNAECLFQVGSLPEIRLGEEDTRALALVLGELGTNSSKYGAIGHGGTVDVSGETLDDQVVIRWSERRRGDLAAEAAVASSGNGVRLMRRALAARGGSIDFDWTPQGPDVTFRLPLRQA